MAACASPAMATAATMAATHAAAHAACAMEAAAAVEAAAAAAKSPRCPCGRPHVNAATAAAKPSAETSATRADTGLRAGAASRGTRPANEVTAKPWTAPTGEPTPVSAIPAASGI
ncbi:hypothetical protein [Rhodoblastus acidophilus]|uniref:hypothetical protein n=1 Tax=Rhodoblastus acidophilus TaxID=1074 RepID=UPI001FED5D04|nr:hypothetical protein [Rhodoblastus acidophilus]